MSCKLSCKLSIIGLRALIISAAFSVIATTAYSQSSSKARVEASTLDGSAMKMLFLSPSPWLQCAKVTGDFPYTISNGWEGNPSKIPLSAARFCSFPGIKPCPDKDGDGVPGCDTSTPKAPVSYEWNEKVVLQNGEWAAGTVAMPSVVGIMASCSTASTTAGALSNRFTSWSKMPVNVSDCPLVRFFSDNQKRTYPDCDDHNRDITVAADLGGDYPGAYASFSITRVDFTAQSKEYAKANNIDSHSRPFTLLDSIAVTITPKRSPCQHAHQKVSLFLVINGKRFVLARYMPLEDKPETFEVSLLTLDHDSSETVTPDGAFLDAVEQVRRGATPYLLVENDDYQKELFDKIPLPLSNCVPLAGGGDKSIAFLRTKSLWNEAYKILEVKAQTEDYSGLLSLAVINMAARELMQELSTVAPFKQHKERFSIWVDLSMHDDSTWISDQFAEAGSSNGTYLTVQNFYQPRQVTSCQTAETVFAFGSSAYRKWEDPELAVAFPLTNTVWVSPGLRKSGDGVDAQYHSWATRQTLTYLHEYAHLIGNLRDEYTKSAPVSGEDLKDFGELWADIYAKSTTRNCAVDPKTTFRSALNGKLYGSTNIEGCGSIDMFRASQQSIMKNFEGGFNVISCSFIQQGILRTPSNQNHLAECAAMPGINTEGVER